MLTLWKTRDDTFSTLSREVDRLMKDVALPASGRSGYGLCPASDVVETEAAFRVVLDLPGLEAKDLQIQVENDTLTVQAERRLSEPGKDETIHRSERAAGTYFRSFALPKTVDATKVEAKYESGVLTVTLPKREEAKPRTIQVTVK